MREGGLGGAREGSVPEPSTPGAREPEETNAGAAMGRQPCRGAKHTEGSAQPCPARARGAGDRGRRWAPVCGPATV